MTEQALAGDQVCVFGPNGRQHRERHWGAPPGDDLVAGESVDAVLRAICGQPAALADALCGRLDGGGAHFRDLPLDPKRLRQVERIILTACGTSYHAALVGEYLFEEFARIPVEVEHAAEFRDRNAPIDGHTLVVALCPSGATADTVAALRECRRKGHPTLAVCDRADGPLAREAHGVIELRAGPDVAAAPVHAFANQVAVLAALAFGFGRMGYLSQHQAARVARELRDAPELVRQALACGAQVRAAAAKYADSRAFLYLGRQYLYPVALEGALKMRQLASLPADGRPAAGEEDGLPAPADGPTTSVFLAPGGGLSPKAVKILEAAKARGGPVVAVAAAGDAEVAARADELIAVPQAPAYLQPLVSVVPVQLLAYHVALLRGRDFGRPHGGTGRPAAVAAAG